MVNDNILKQATFWAQVATVVLVIFVGYQIYQSNQEFELDKRPWVGVYHSPELGDLQIRSFINEKGEEITAEEFKKLTMDEKNNFNASLVNWSFTLKNFGKSPAVDIQARAVATAGMKPLKTGFGEFGKKSNLMSGEERVSMFTMPVTNSDAIQKKESNAYISYDLIYGEQYSKQDYRYGITIKMTGGDGYLIQKTWDEKSFDDIKFELLDEPTIISNKP